MKKLFTAIRKKDNETVKQLIERKPELVNCTAKQPPKKDDGQSPLQVALKTGNFEIADFLLDKGADINFMECEETCYNDWRVPVLHDAVIAAVMNCRYMSAEKYAEIYGKAFKPDESYAVLERMLKMGADINKRESFGAGCAYRLCRQAEEYVLPRYNYGTHEISSETTVSDELRSDLSRLFLLLKRYGADFSDEEIKYRYKDDNNPVREFLELVKD